VTGYVPLDGSPAQPFVRLVAANGESVALDDSVLIGRQPEPVDLGLENAGILRLPSDDPEASRDHALVTAMTDHIRVFDLDSTNGTIIERDSVAEQVNSPEGHRLEIGDSLIIGSSVITVEYR